MATTAAPPATGLVERISEGSDTLAILIRAGFEPCGTLFLTPPELTQQVGFVVRAAGSEIPRHDHPQRERSIRGVPECLIVRRGLSEVTLYNRRREEVCRRMLRAGDVLLLVAGGHAFRQLEDTLFLEVKQGPYPGPADKERF